ncbi:hypothetical protein [Aminobacter sp. MDW-2]|uniref:hypothetical protein n=1 Tax=Aminobacter sp. MDW-2 TaxID=2666139 RepID=UPI0012AF144D|nr:hypothetical protein [Aminobacter sp. MDW-2]MRX32825.1 hypothetical protein [Aminobacter sp. MDW-2]QNH34517.1 hypothetical protein H5P29_00750 [Aminobacter sp. MDW-2]
MTVITRQRSDKFAIIPNAVAEDETISFEARGLLCYLLAKPDNWRVQIDDIRRAGNIGRDKAYRLLGELKDAGYIEVDVQRDESRRIIAHNYLVYDCAVLTRMRLDAQPASEPLPENPDVAKPLPEKPEVAPDPLPENPETGKSGRINKNPENNTHSPLPPAGADFDQMVEGWSKEHLPDRIDAAFALFSRLSEADRPKAAALARTYCRLMVARGKAPLMMPYLKSRLFVELDGAPPFDRDGDFIITPDRPEWRQWLGNIRGEHGERAVESTVRLGKLLRKTRWPVTSDIPQAPRERAMA